MKHEQAKSRKWLRMGKSSQESESLINIELPEGAEPSIKLDPMLKRTASSIARGRAEIQAVDKDQALANRRAKAIARREAIEKAKQEYAAKAKPQGNSDPQPLKRTAEEEAAILKAREDIKSVDKNQARINMQKKAQERREAIQRARDERHKGKVAQVHPIDEDGTA